MKVLFLDDDKNRHEKFRMAHIGVDVTYVWSAEEAIKALNEAVFDEASLDHDLGGEVTHNTLPGLGDGSGYDVACYIAAMPFEKRPKLVVIHSFNQAGSFRMGQALKKAWQEGMKVIRQPFDY